MKGLWDGTSSVGMGVSGISVAAGPQLTALHRMCRGILMFPHCAGNDFSSPYPTHGPDR